MFDNLIFIIEILGTIAFSISGVLVARQKKMDIRYLAMRFEWDLPSL